MELLVFDDFSSARKPLFLACLCPGWGGGFRTPSVQGSGVGEPTGTYCKAMIHIESSTKKYDFDENLSESNNSDRTDAELNCLFESAQLSLNFA